MICLVQATLMVATKHNIQLVPFHVKSHQDQETSYAKLPWEAKLNCDVDKLAAIARICTRFNTGVGRPYILVTPPPPVIMAQPYRLAISGL